ncbi:MAG: sulfite exporter TauE/SafE family protein [bacterium]|nr:sulfite exporter TauE/SafE family protein [bacterium]
MLAVSGALIAAFSVACGIGGGLIGVPVLHYLFGLPLRRAVATTLALVFASATASTVTEALHPDAALYPGLIVTLAATALVGAQLGFFIAKRISTVRLKMVFCLVIAGSGLRVILKDPGLPPLEDFLPSQHDYLLVGAIGLFAGVVVPLLGVGGGLIMVPSLLFGMPDIGYLGARATSLAVATVTSARSLAMYAKEKDVAWPTARWFAAGALVGAVCGVWIVHLPGVPEVGQVLLGVLLCVSSIRFGLDVARSYRASDADFPTETEETGTG